MSPASYKIFISEEFIQKCHGLEKGVGLVYGVIGDDKYDVFGFTLCKTPAVIKRLHVKEGLDIELSKCLSYTEASLPAGFKIIGHIYFENDAFQVKEQLEQAVTSLHADGTYENKENLLMIEAGAGGIVVKLGEVIQEHEIVSDMLDSYVLVRLQGQLSINIERDLDIISKQFQIQLSRAKNTVYTFYFEKSSVYLTNDEEIIGTDNDAVVKSLIDGSNKKKQQRKSDEIDIIECELFAKPVKYMSVKEPDAISDCAPVVQQTKRDYKVIVVPLVIDTLSIISKDLSLIDLYTIISESLQRQLISIKFCILSEIKSRQHISTPIPFHFKPRQIGHFITLVYPSDIADKDLAEVRDKRHDIYVLSKDQPAFRRPCKFIFPSDLPLNSPLFNPHEGLQNPTLGTESVMSLVKGRYRYYHYMQDNFDDNGWGCAYRSLQTLVSWFQLQGYTDISIPSHREIQQCLVNIGDKQPSFIGSRQWIGSTEVSFCLETLLNISSRILSVNSGIELSQRADELVRHFDTHGTPIMIGGGVLAHTILGVCLNQETNDVRFLILDPHYTGSEDINIIQSKGWCGWKGSDFWVKNAFYNLCMPQKPRAI